MAIALRATNGATRSGSGTLAVPVPTGTVSGDVLVIFLTVSGTTGMPATPTGLTLLDSAALGPSFGIYYRVCDGTEGASFSFSVGNTAGATSRSYSGVSNSTPINTHSVPNRVAASGTTTATTITPSVNNCMLVFGSATAANATAFTNPTSYLNQQLNTISGGCDVSCDLAQTTAAATGSVSGTWNASNNNYASLVALTPASGAPVNTVAPVVSGTTHVGSTLSTTNGTWTDAGGSVFTYQWQHDVQGNGIYSNISSATSSTYTLVDADDGCNIRCVVTDTDSTTQSTSANSNSVGTVTEPVPVNTVAPVVSGSSSPVGQTLSVTNGTWSNMGGINTSYTYQWTRDGANISAATSSTYVTQSADLTHAVGCTVTAHNTGGTASQASSNTLTISNFGPTIAGKTGTSGSAVMQKSKSGWTYVSQSTNASGTTAIDQKGAPGFTKVKGH